MNSNKSRLNIVITGASKGIGLATARQLSTFHTLHLIARTHKAVDDELNNDNVFFYTADLSSSESLRALVSKIQKNTVNIDVLINNAGGYIENKFDDTSFNDIDNLIKLNLKGQIEITRLLLPLIKKGNAPLIINMSSSAALSAPINQSVYAATKAGFAAFSDALRKELNEKGIRVSTIYPSAVNTRDIDSPQKNLTPEDVAYTIEYILSVRKNCQIKKIELDAL
jgi:short-subunit dehydrogenase